MSDKMITYANKEDPTGQRFIQYSKDIIPSWAVDIKEVEESFEGSIPLPNGYNLYWKPNEAGGRTYYSDEIGDGVIVWDTCLCNESTLQIALTMEAMFDRELRKKKG